MHLVARRAGAAGLATGRYPWRLVVPDGEQRAIGGDRDVGLPLGLGRLGITVELEWSAKGPPAVSRTNVKNVARVAGHGVGGGIDVVDHAVESGGLTPAHMPPVSRAAVHAGEVTRIGAVRP